MKPWKKSGGCGKITFLDDMFPRTLLISLVFAFSGCTAATAPASRQKEEILNSYLTGVQRFDGIDLKEAVILARAEVMFRENERRYYLDRPELEYENAREYGIRFYPVNKSFQEVISNPSVLVIIDKKTGEARLYPGGLSHFFIDTDPM